MSSRARGDLRLMRAAAAGRLQEELDSTPAPSPSVLDREVPALGHGVAAPERGRAAGATNPRRASSLLARLIGRRA